MGQLFVRHLKEGAFKMVLVSTMFQDIANFTRHRQSPKVVEWLDGLAPNRQEMSVELEYHDELPNRRGYEGRIAYIRGTSYQSRKPSRHGLGGPNAHARAGQTCGFVGLRQWCILSGMLLPFRRHSQLFFPTNPGHGCLSPFGGLSPNTI